MIRAALRHRRRLILAVLRPWAVATPQPAPPSMTIFAAAAGGQIGSGDFDYATARGGGGVVATSTAAFNRTGQLFAGSVYNTYQSVQEFDVSGLPGDAVAATLSLVIGADNSATDFVLQVREYDFGDSFEAADFVAGDDVGDLTLLASLDTAAGLAVGQYNALTSEAALVDAINAALAGSGLLRVLLVSQRFVDGVPPTGSEELAYWSGRDTADPTRRPKLEIVYQTTE